MTPLPRQPQWLKKLKWTICKPDFLEIYSTKFKHCCNLYFVQIFSSVHSSWNDPFLSLIGRGTTTLYGPMSTVVLPGLNNPRLIEYVVAPLGATQGKASRDFWRTGAFLRCFIPKTMFTDYLGSPTWNKEAHACGLECLDLGFFEDIHSIRNLGKKPPVEPLLTEGQTCSVFDQGLWSYPLFQAGQLGPICLKCCICVGNM